MIEDKTDIARMIAYLMRETLNKYAHIELTDAKYDELITEMEQLLEKFSEDKNRREANDE